MTSPPGGRFLGPGFAFARAVLRIRADERRPVAGAFLTLLGFMTGHALLETARDALFLSAWPARSLPWVYLAIAAVALLLSRRPPRLLARLRTQHELGAWLVLAAIVTTVFWSLAVAPGRHQRWVAPGIYVWSGVLATLVAVRFWTALGGLFTVTQAKRLFALIGSGSVAGAILGSGIARLLSAALPTAHLVLAAAGAFLLTALAPALLVRSEDYAGTPADAWRFRDVARMIGDRPYLRRVALLILLATLTVTLVDYVFKSTVDRMVPNADLGEFFAGVYFGLNTLSLVVQLLLTGWLVRRFGVNTVQLLMPALLLAAGFGVVAVGGLGFALLLKGVDGTLRYSLYRTGTEILFVPLSMDIRGRAKAVIDVVGQRGGQAVASLAILAVIAFTGQDLVVSLVTVAAAAAWLMVALDLRPHYVNVFRETLRDDLTETRIAFPALDVASLETLLRTLNDSDDRKVMAALEVLAHQGRVAVVPALILYHPSPRVVLLALELFERAGRTDVGAIAERLSGHADPRIGAAALRTLVRLRPGEPLIRRALEHPAAEVRVTAVVGLAGLGGMPVEAARDLLLPTVREGPPDAQLALLAALRAHPSVGLNDLAIALLEAPTPAVRVAAARAMSDRPTPECIGPLMRALSDRALRDAARIALVAQGPPALARLDHALGDPNVPTPVRRHLARAVAAFGSVEAAAVLGRHLLSGGEGLVQFQILRALGRLRSTHPDLPVDETVLGQAVDQTITLGFAFLRWRRALETGAQQEPGRETPLHRLLVALLRHKQQHAVERIFRLLNLLARDEEYARIHRALRRGRAASQAGGRELLEHVVPDRLREPLLALIDTDEEGPRSRLASRGEPSYSATLRELVLCPVESLSALGAAHAAELGTLEVVQSAMDARPAPSPHLAEVFRRVRADGVRAAGGAG